MKMSVSNTLLITGVSGFLGSTLAERCLKDGYKVIGLDRKKESLSSGFAGNKNFIFLEADMNNSIGEVLKGFEIGGIFHLASQQPSSPLLTYEDFYTGNVQTTLNVINLAKTRNVKFIVYTSTIFLFGGQSRKRYIIDEKSFSIPTNHYTLTKYLAEKLLEIELKKTDTKVIIIRYPSLFGKSHLGGIVYTYYQLAKKGYDIEVYGNGKRYRNLLYVKDAVYLLLETVRNIDKLEKFEIFMAGGKDSLRMIEIARIIKRLLNSSSKIMPVDKHASTNTDLFVNISKAKRMLRFNPMSFEEGLKSYIRDLGNEI